ncbi:ATP-binding cassette domain-containing protein, partial [Chromobacterium haemolyticum]|uniref:ATP-binding cassette domain-containing protein n=1 Tax=Chromobacterium haemolyticum TaxID=394935 RepID=UPI000D3F5565
MGAEMRGVFKQYWLDQIKVPALLNVNLKVAAARFTVLAGPSGSGKSTILHLLGGMDRPDSGDIVIAGQSIAHSLTHNSAGSASRQRMRQF